MEHEMPELDSILGLPDATVNWWTVYISSQVKRKVEHSGTSLVI